MGRRRTPKGTAAGAFGSSRNKLDSIKVARCNDCGGWMQGGVHVNARDHTDVEVETEIPKTVSELDIECSCGFVRNSFDDCLLCGAGQNEAYFEASRVLTEKEHTEFDYQGHLPDTPATEGIALVTYRVA